MSEVSSRPSASRGRGSGRGGRGGFAGRGARRANGDKPDPKSGADDASGAFDDEGDFAELRKQYGGKTTVIREMFPDWSEVDVLFALQETNGDENEAVTRMSEGSISQWGEVPKTKKTTRPKAKEPTAAPPNNEASATGSRPARGGRAVSEGVRGRGRATDRGGRGGRARPTQPATNGSRQKENQQLSTPTEEAAAWGNEQAKAEAPAEAIVEQPPSPEVTKPAAPQGKTWASMLRQSTAPKAVPKPKEAPAPKPTETAESLPTAEPVQPEPETVADEETTPVAEHATPAQPAIIEPEIALPPSQDELTRTNLEQVVDDSKPAATGTAASTAADSWDPRQNPISATATPISAAQQQHQTQRPPSGYAAAALKATSERTTRPISYQRRVLDQEEAVRMPGNREVDRAAVQFGAFSLNGGDEDIDGEREEPETRAQPPADSPVAHPRASLPPVVQPAVPEPYQQKTVAAPPGVPAPTAPAAQPSAATQPPSQQFGRFAQTNPQEQKPLDPFNQANAPSSQPPFDNFGAQTSQPPSQQPGGAFTSAPNDYSSYYTANQQERTPYSYYGQQFGQQGQGQQGAQGAQSQDGTPAGQRAFGGGYNASQQSDNLSQYPQSGSVHNQPRFGGAATDSQNSGHNTPNPTTQSQHQQPQQQPQAAQQPGAPGSQPGHGQQYPGYNHPYYTNPYYQQYYSGYGQGGNFGPYGGKGGGGGMYGQPYGVSPNAPYEHASSPASFGQSSAHRDSGISSGLGEYGRTGSGPAGGAPGLGGSSFGSVQDSFSRGSSSFQSQGHGFNSQAQPAAGASSDELKPFGDAKSGAGPSPALGGARPGSAANNASTGQSGLPPPQNSQMGGGYGGYPSHLQQGHAAHGNNAYGMGGAAGPGQHGNSPYGSYGQGGFGGSGGYYGGNQQQRGGWGGNYH